MHSLWKLVLRLSAPIFKTGRLDYSINPTEICTIADIFEAYILILFYSIFLV